MSQAYCTSLDVTRLPNDLRSLPQFVGAKQEIVGANLIKRPKNPHTGGNASVSDPATWGSAEEAIAGRKQHWWDSIGIVLRDDDPWLFIDLDHVIDPDTGDVTPWAAALIARFPGAYVEKSQSGRGLHIICRSEPMLPPGGKSGGRWPLANGQAVEIYWSRRYCWLTTDVMGDRCADPLPDHTAQVRALWDSLPARKQNIDREWGNDEATPGSLRSNEEIIRRAKAAANGAKFALLWRGEWKAVIGDDGKPAYQSWSEADQGFVGMLSYWAGRHAGKIYELVQASGMFRDKWKRADYIESTIEGVLSTRGAEDFYQWPDETTPRIEYPTGDITALDLLSGDYGPPQMLIRDILPVGTHLLVGPPKTGKSWMALQTADAVARGTDLMGYPCETPGDVLYLALEDTLRRLFHRYRLLLFGPGNGVPLALDDDTPFDLSAILQPPENLTFRLTNPTLAEGGLEAIRDWVQRAANPRLVIIDVLGRFRGDDERRGKSAYAIDQASISAIHDFASAHGLTVLLIHHTRKSAPNAKPGDGDALEKISGTMGIAGSVDNLWVLSRGRGENGAEMFISGREISYEQTLALQFDPATVRWRSLGDADKLAKNVEQEAVLSALAQHRSMTAGELADWLGITAATARKRLSRMWQARLIQRENGRYSIGTKP